MKTPEASEQYRTIFEAVSDGLVIHEDGIIIAVNPQFNELIGYSDSELVGKSFMQFVAEESKAFVIDRMRTRPGTPYEIEGVTKDGRRIPVEVVGKDIQHEGRTVRVVVVRDLTEINRARLALEESDKRYRDLFEEAPVWYTSSGTDGRVQLANRAAAEVMGCTPEELVGQQVLGLCADTPEGKPKAKKVFERFRAGEDIRDEEILLQRADGEQRWISLSVHPNLDANGRVISSRATAVDITERKRLEETLQHFRDELETKVEAKMQGGSQYGLTFRELTVLHLLAAGRMDKEIARELGIKPYTASRHVKNIMGKMNAPTRTDAGVRAVREGLVD